MKLYKFISFASLAVLVFALFLLASLPFRFPHSSIAWQPALLFLSPAIVLVALLFLKPILSRRVFLLTLGFFVLIYVLLTLAGWMSPILLGIFLMACLPLYFGRNAATLDIHRK